MLRPPDVVICLYLAMGGKSKLADVAEALGMAISSVHRAMNRARMASLLSDQSQPVRANLMEFLAHGVRYAFYAECGPIVRGVITGAGAPGLSREIVSTPENSPVWPSSSGRHRGSSLEPLTPHMPDIVAQNIHLHSALGAVDLIRIGRARERGVAIDFLHRLLKDMADDNSP